MKGFGMKRHNSSDRYPKMHSSTVIVAFETSRRRYFSVTKARYNRLVFKDSPGKRRNASFQKTGFKIL